MNVILVDSGAFPNGSMGNFLCLAPLGLLSLAGAVRDIADKITIFDNRLPNSTELWEADVLGVRAMIHNIPYAMEFLQKVKRFYPRIKTVLGGFYATLNPEYVDESCIDHIVLREGEISFRKILLGETTEKYVESPLIENLDDLPFPAYDLIDTSKYHATGLRAISLESSRGCPYNCNFCSVKKFFKDTYRFKSIPRVIAEIDTFTEQNQNAVLFIDDNHTFNVKRAMRLCDAIIDNGLDHILYFCQSRVDTLARHPELVKRMAEAGYYCMYLGVESPYQASLNGMNKNQTWQDAKQAIKLLNKYGIVAYASLVVGSPNETVAMVKQYPKFVQELQASFVHFFVYTFFPNTDAYNQIKDDIPILIDDLRYYDASICTFKHPYIDPRRLNELYVEIYKEYYSDIKSYLPLMRDARRLLARFIPKRIKKRIINYLSAILQGKLLKSGQIALNNISNAISDANNIFRFINTHINLFLSQGRDMITRNINEVNANLYKSLNEENEV